MRKKFESCRKCKASFKGEPIPQEYRKHYGDATHFSNKIGIYSREKDRTVEWMCHKCGFLWKA